MKSTESNNSLLRNTLWLAWSGAINIANSVVLWLVLARWRTPAEVGQFAAVMSLYTIFITVCGLGLTPYLASELSHRTERRRLAASATLLLLLSSGVCAVLMMLTGLFTGAGTQTATNILSLAILPTGLIAVGEAVFTALGQARVIAAATTTENLLRTVIPLALLYRGHSLPVICASFVLVRLAACAVYVLAAWRRFGLPPLPEWRAVRDLAGAAPTFAGVTVLAALHWQLGTVLAARLGGANAAAQFGVAARFLLPVTILLWSYVSVIQPRAACLAQESLPRLGEFLAGCWRLTLALALPLAAGGLTLGSDLMTLLFGPTYADAAWALGLLAAGIVPFSLTMIASRGLIATGRQHVDLLGNLAAVALNLILNLLLIPRYGATGAAAAQLFSLTAQALVAPEPQFTCPPPVATVKVTAAFGTTFAIIFTAEWGDLTQLITAGQAARTGAPLSVFLGSWLALTAVAGFGVLVGAWLQKRVPLWRIGIIGGVVLAILAAVTLVELVRA